MPVKAFPQKNTDSKVEKLKIPPHSIEAEQSVLGSMLIAPDSWDKVAEIVVEEDFYNRSHQIIYRAIVRLLTKNHPIDLITVSEDLEGMDELEPAGGFAYLGEVDERIAMPRLNTPRMKVPKGAVAIADRQTAIYPSTSPGGWNIIGLCPVEMFNANNNPNMPVQVGDRVKFKAISRDEFSSLGGVLGTTYD